MGRKRKRTQRDGFVAWSDLELDTILGDYTDLELRHGSSGSDSDVEIPRSANELKSKSSRVCYSCPECGASLKTITGFRGHMKRKHQRTDVRGL